MKVTKEFIETNWSLTDVKIKEMSSQGMAGTVGIVESKEGKYTYKISGSWKTPENLDKDLGAYDFLNNSGFKYISQLLQTKNTKRFVEVDSKLIYLIKFIEGLHPAFIPETYSELGKITAELHSIKAFPFESNYRPASAIPQLIEKAEKYPFKEEYVAILKNIPDFTHLPIVPIHTEITPGNVIQMLGGKIVVIDWDEVGLGPAVLDLGVGLINHLVTEDLEVLEENAEAYYSAYRSVRKISDEENKYMYDAALFWACCWVSYGNIEKRWKRIKWALENRKLLEELSS